MMGDNGATTSGNPHDYGSSAMVQGDGDGGVDEGNDHATAPTHVDGAVALDAAQMPSTDGQSKAITTSLK